MILLLLLIGQIFASDIPEQVHVAVGAYPGLIQFTWNTRLPTPTSAVRIGLNPSYLKYYYGSSDTFTNGTNSWVIHTANATLYPGSTYIYQVGCILTNFSQVFNLTVPPSSGSSSTYLVYADLDIGIEGNASWIEIEKRWPQLNVDAVIHMGDIAYDLSSDYATWGDTFMNAIQPVASSVPYMVCVGNHEGDDNYVNYLARFVMPNNGFYYTWASGYVRFLAIDTETIMNQDTDLSVMMTYIQSVLNRTQADKEAYPWLIVYGHRPLYCASDQKKKCGSESRLLQNTLETLFYTYNVDLYINGHVHNYERTTPVYQEKVMGSGGSGNVYIDPLAPIYITTGGIGADGENTNMTTTGVPTWIAASDVNLSYSIFTAFNATTLHWQQWETGKNKTSDDFWIIKGSSAFAEQ